LPTRNHAIQITIGHTSAAAPGARAGEVALTPALDIFETPEGLVLEADLAGACSDQLVVQVHDNLLTIQAATMQPTCVGTSTMMHQEFLDGVYSRSFILSDEVDRERITAEWRNGVLRIVLPRAERTRTRRIEVKST
jgi:HSP20 family protein